MSLVEEYHRLKNKLELYEYIYSKLEDDSNELIYEKKIDKLERRIRDLKSIIENLETDDDNYDD